MWTLQPCCSGAGLCAVVDGVDPDCGREAFLLPETERSEKNQPEIIVGISSAGVVCDTDFAASGSS